MVSGQMAIAEERAKVRVYLAGTLGTEWRDEIRGILEAAGMAVLVPGDNEQYAPAEYVPGDIRMVRESDYVFVYFDPEAVSRGTYIEMGLAYAWKKPQWVAWPASGPVYQWVPALAYRCFTGDGALLMAAQNLAMHVSSGAVTARREARRGRP